MSAEAKIHLSKLETELVTNKDWILTKQGVINKIFQFFGELNETFKKISGEETSLPAFFKNTNGKISKGENYEGLPYVMLDYPAMFSKENIFAIRTMFWWGNFFSITLHLSGEQYKLSCDYLEIQRYLSENDFFICVNENEWQHTFDISNYVSAKKLDEDTFKKISDKNFFKISKKLELEKWNEAPEFLEKGFREIIQFIKINYPNGETVPSPGFPKAGSGL